MNDATFGTRMRGRGVIADQIQQTFRLFARKSGLDGQPKPLDSSHFSPPKSGQQLELF